MAWTAPGAACACEASDDRDDRTYVKHRSTQFLGDLMIDAGRIDCDGRLLGRFAWPECQPEMATDFLKSALRDQGWTQQSQVAVLVDGADDPRTVVEVAIGHKPRTILDWFHISMRLRCIEQMAGALAARFPAGDFQQKLGLLSRVRWSMWNGQRVRATERLRDAFRAARASIEAASAPDRQRIVRLNRRLLELRDYLRRNWSHLTNYGKAQRDGLRISTSTAESGMNHLVNKRMCKRQSMRWSRRGADALLQVRCILLDGEPEDLFRDWYPRFRRVPGGRSRACAG
jgi:hypothetical protein